MRRALLTATTAKAPISVGNPAVLGNGSLAPRVGVDLSSPATTTGTVTSVSIYVAAANASVYFMVGSFAAGTFTVRSVSVSCSTATGLNTFSVSLPIVAGDYIGCWGASTSAQAKYTSGTGTLGYTGAVTTLPTAGTQFALTSTAGLLSIQGAG